jgi:hypothetical protein
MFYSHSIPLSFYTLNKNLIGALSRRSAAKTEADSTVFHFSLPAVPSPVTAG